MSNSINKEKALKLAEKLGLKVSFKKPESKVILDSNEYNIEDFFPELQELKGNYVTKDEDCFEDQIILKVAAVKLEGQQHSTKTVGKLAESA